MLSNAVSPAIFGAYTTTSLLGRCDAKLNVYKAMPPICGGYSRVRISVFIERYLEGPLLIFPRILFFVSYNVFIFISPLTNNNTA